VCTFLVECVVLRRVLMFELGGCCGDCLIGGLIYLYVLCYATRH